MSDDERILNLPSVQPVSEFRAELDTELDSSRDAAYEGIGPLAVTLARQKADQDLSPFQPKDLLETQRAEQTRWDDFKAGRPIDADPERQ